MYQIRLKQYEGSSPIREEAWKISCESGEMNKKFTMIPCDVTCCIEKDSIKTVFNMKARAIEDMENPVSLSLELAETAWKKANYVFMPAAAYDGNRMESRCLPYPPYSAEKTKQGWVPVISDIPHLDVASEDSRIQFLSGDMSTPAMGYYDWEKCAGMLMLAKHMECERYTGFTISESVGKAIFRITSPGVREEKKYFFGELPDDKGFYPTCSMPSDDEGILLKKGEEVTLEVCVYSVMAESITEYFKAFNGVRECMEQGEEFTSIPFSKAFEAVKLKYLKMNFDSEGYYRVGSGQDNPPSFWQAGWVGGGMNSFPLMMEDKNEAYRQAKSTVQFIATHLQEENGWYVPMYAKGKKYGDAFTDEEAPILLVRKAADLLYMMVKQAMYLRKQGENVNVVDASIKAQADAFVRFVKKYGQLGQFIDMKTETLVMGDTACAASAVAALSLAYEYTGEKSYLEIAEYLGEWYLKIAVETGIANGCPGEICQASDSEAAFGLLEGYVQLYETTRNEKWLNAAKDAFEMAITWVVSYDFIFPNESTARNLGAHTRGTVFANVQNKHSAPGICTWSGNSLLKLYRFTGDIKYLEWMKRISHALSQFVSLEERPVNTLAGKPLIPGYFNERVQTSDWEGKHTVGEFLYGSNWPEVTMLLTYVEIPGIYVDLDRNELLVSDHVNAEIVEKTESYIRLRVRNLTKYDAIVTLLVDRSKEKEQLGHLYYENMQKLEVKAGAEELFDISID